MIKILGQIKDSKLPDIETERLYLRPRLVSDAEDIFAYASLPEVTWPAGFPPAESVEAEAYYLENIMPKRWSEKKIPAGYGICLKGTNKVIGSVDFNNRHADDVVLNENDLAALYLQLEPLHQNYLTLAQQLKFAAD